MIDYIAYFFVSLITIFAFLIAFKRVINIKCKYTISLVLLLVIGSVITTILSYIGNGIIKNFYTIFFFILIFKIVSKKPVKELFYYALILWIYGMAIDFVNMLVVSFTQLPKYLDMIYVRSLAGTVISVVMVFICSIPIVKEFTRKTVEKLLKINKSILTDLVLILSIIFLSVICFVNINELSLTLFSVFISLLLIFSIYMFIAKNYHIKRLKEVNKILTKNNEFYVKLDSDYRILKHNITHQLQGIKLVSNDKAKELIDDLITSYNSEFAVSRDINKIPGDINGIIYEKFYSFDDKDINLAVENTVDSQLVDILKARTFNNLCETLGVLVDNALEAASESEEKAILIDFSEDKNSLSISVSNTFNSELDIDKLGEKSYSTKGKSHGIGLFSIFRKSDIRIKTKIINNLFQTELNIKKASL